MDKAELKRLRFYKYIFINTSFFCVLLLAYILNNFKLDNLFPYIFLGLIILSQLIQILIRKSDISSMSLIPVLKPLAEYEKSAGNRTLASQPLLLFTIILLPIHKEKNIFDLLYYQLPLFLAMINIITLFGNQNVDVELDPNSESRKKIRFEPRSILLSILVSGLILGILVIWEYMLDKGFS